MKNYTCEKCGTSIKPPVCAKCDCVLEDKTIEKDGKRIEIAECPQCKGKIKSPQCCGSDMSCQR